MDRPGDAARTALSGWDYISPASGSAGTPCSSWTAPRPPSATNTIAEQSKNYRYSTDHQVVIDADTRLVMVVGRPLPGRPERFVLSGSREELARIKLVFEKVEGVRGFVPFRVSGPFHAPAVSPAAARFRSLLASVDVGELRTPVISSVTGRPVGHDAQDVRELLTEQIAKPVRWTDCIRYLHHRHGPHSPSTRRRQPGRWLVATSRMGDRGRRGVRLPPKDGRACGATRSRGRRRGPGRC